MRNSPSELPHFDLSLSFEDRVDHLIAAMTLEQKASQMVDNCIAIPELGIPAYSWFNEALHGIASAGIATVFPQAIALAATFNVTLLHDVAHAIGVEGRAKHRETAEAGNAGAPFSGLTFYSPNINLFRDPRWGRGQETYGEDPHLTARMGHAFITGLQGDDRKYLLVGSTAKHYAAHSGPERGRHSFNAQVSAHDLEDSYLPAFRTAVMEAKVSSVMAAYNAVNGVPACAHEFLLDQRLKKDWGFNGQIVSDCDGVRSIHEQHRWSPSMSGAYASSIKAGMTSILDFTYGKDPSALLEAVRLGELTESDLDAPLRANFLIRFRLGMFDPPESVPYAQIPVSANDSAEHRALATEAARQSLVLLKNDGILPIAQAPARIAVVGPLADSRRVLIGSYHGTPSSVTTMLDGIRARFPQSEVVFEPGMTFLRDPETVPADLLFTETGAAGVALEFFAGTDFDGAVIATRHDPTIFYDGTGRTRPVEVPENAPVRWTTYLVPTETGQYELGVAGNSNRLFLDGALLIDDAGPHAPRNTLASVHLEAGRRYHIRMELFPGLEQHSRLIWLRDREDALKRALAAAANADIVIATVGISAELENEEIKTDVPGFEGGDRLSLDMPEIEQQLLRAVKATGKPLVVALTCGGPISPVWAVENANAILQCWYPGEEGGVAIAETIAGLNNPAGRLPVTLYRDVRDLPAFADYSMANRTYRYFDGKPLYPFGHGLSYTRFTYGEATAPASICGAEGIRIVTNITNMGDVAGDEVAQLYLSFPAQAVGAPHHALRGFQRIRLAPGETREISFTLDLRDLSSVDPEGVRSVRAGQYSAWIGGGQPGTSAGGSACSFMIEGDYNVAI